MDLKGGLEFQAHLPIETILAMVIRSSGQPEGKKINKLMQHTGSLSRRINSSSLKAAF